MAEPRGDKRGQFERFQSDGSIHVDSENPNRNILTNEQRPPLVEKPFDFKYNQINSRTTDLGRFLKFLKTPGGLKMQGNLAILQQSNRDLKETFSRNSKPNGTLLGNVLRTAKEVVIDTIKTNVGFTATLAKQIPVNGTGTHFVNNLNGPTYLKQGGDPKSALGNFLKSKVEIAINEEFTIVEKASKATVEAIRMNILYEGLSNPVSIVLPDAVSLQPGGKTKNVKLDPNVNKSDKDLGANFYAKPLKDAKEAFIQITGIINGKREATEPKRFRVKKAPDGIGAIENDKAYKSGSSVSQFNILNGQVTGYKPADFDYEFNVEVTRFIVSVGTNQALTIDGNFIEGLAEDYVRQAPSGTPIIFSSIEAIAWEGSNKNEAFTYKVNDFTLKKQ